VVLQIIVAVEDIVLAVILVLGGYLHTSQRLCEGLARWRALLIARIGVAAPGQVGLGEVGVAAPVAGVDQRQDARAIAAGLAAKDAIARLAGRLGRVEPGPQQLGLGGQGVLTREVLAKRLVQRDHHLAGLVEQRDQVREGIAEEAADPADHVDARAAQLGQRDDLDAQHAPVLGLPARAQAQQRQHLGDIVSGRAHRAGAPDADAHAGGILAGLALVPADQVVGQALPDLPGRHARQRTRVDRIEIAAGRQHMRHAARRRAARPRRDMAAI
jgi:hypothetical protein